MNDFKTFILKTLEKFAIIPRFNLENQPCYDKYGRFLGYFSRSMAVSVFMFCKDKNGIWNILASERGVGAADYQGYWNCVCGYVERNTTVIENCIKEVHEEVGIDISEDDLEFIGFNDSPLENHQNVTFRYCAFFENKTTDDFTFSHKWNEKDEVGMIKWIPIDNVDQYMWAFNHKEIIKEIFSKKIGK